MFPWVCSVIDRRGHQNVVKTSVALSPAAPVPLLCFYHILTSSIMVFNWEEVGETEGSRNRDSNVIKSNNVATRICTLQVYISSAMLTTRNFQCNFKIPAKMPRYLKVVR